MRAVGHMVTFTLISIRVHKRRLCLTSNAIPTSRFSRTLNSRFGLEEEECYLGYETSPDGCSQTAVPSQEEWH